MDISEQAILRAREAANERSLSNCHFHVFDVSNLPADWTENWDFIIIFDALHDIPHTTKALSEMYRTLKKDSYLSVVDLNMHT